MVRPYPPASLLELSDLSSFGICLAPAPEVWEWLQVEILSDTGSIHNEDHAHLLDADIRILWASSSFEKQGRTVLGQAEQVAFRAGGWRLAAGGLQRTVDDLAGRLAAQASSHSCTAAASQAASCAVLVLAECSSALMKERETWRQMLIRAGEGE